MIATGNHDYLDSLRGAPLAWESPSVYTTIPFYWGIATPAFGLVRNDISIYSVQIQLSVHKRVHEEVAGNGNGSHQQHHAVKVA